MARLVTSGLEISLTGGSTGLDPQQSTGTVTRDTVIFRSGSRSLKCVDSTSFSIISQFPGPPTDIYFRGYWYFSDATPGNDLTFVKETGNSSIVVCNLQLLTTGVLRLQNGAADTTIATGATVLQDNTWYRIEIFIGLVVGNDNYEVRIDGVTEFSGSAALTVATSIQGINVGNVAGTVTLNTYLDDIAINDNSGANQTSWPGSGKVVLCKPVSDVQDGSWTAGAGGTGDLSLAITNTPPVGSATPTNTSQIRNTDASGDNATDEYRANLTTYSNAGIVAADTITLLHPVINDGQEVATGTKTGSFGLQSNPSQTYLAFTYCDDVGASGTFPTNWRWHRGTVEYAPSVTLASNPVMAVRKTDTGTRMAWVDGLFMYVEYVPFAGIPRHPATDFNIALV